jgi:GT2 family glycosyltransferase
VDNASGDDSVFLIRERYPQVKIIRNTERQGFSTNNNLVLELGQGRYLMLLNDDTLVVEGALDRLVEYMAQHQAVGAVGAQLLNPDGSIQPYRARFPHPVLEAIYPATNWSYRAFPSKESRDVDSVCGAALMVRREVYEAIGGLDTTFDPIYSEEVDWCYRIRKAGWRIVALPTAQVIHYGSYTMNRVVVRKYELLLSHKALFFRKHYGSTSAEIYKSVLRLTTYAKVVGWSLVAFLRRGCHTCRERQRLHQGILQKIPDF